MPRVQPFFGPATQPMLYIWQQEMVTFLLEEANANLEASDGDGDTALTWAAWSSRRQVMDQLLAAGANSGFVDSISREQFEAVQGDGDSLEYIRKKRLEISGRM